VREASGTTVVRKFPNPEGRLPVAQEMWLLTREKRYATNHAHA
jgi:hypothetical protein